MPARAEEGWAASRACRAFGNGGTDQRNPFQRDKDRILYSSAFRRLSGITQIVRAGEEDVFHDRLIHSIKVAQVGRRLAEKLREQYTDSVTVLDPDVVEAACLAHDLGHPPFGHAGEKRLHQLVALPDLTPEQRKAQNADDGGFEGNAQSFRILTRLSVRWKKSSEGLSYQGLDLTKATLAATLKYPWLPSDSRAGGGKWGAYPTEKDMFDWCRAGWPSAGKTIEAQVMDWADDITYSVHDLEDFHRCGAIPWRNLFAEPISDGEPSTHGARLVDTALKKWKKEAGAETPVDAQSRLWNAHASIREILKTCPSITDETYTGTRVQRQELRKFNSMIVNYFMTNTAIESGPDGQLNLAFNEDSEEVARLLKAITIDYIIRNPALRAQQIGQMGVIEDLFGQIYYAVAGGELRDWFPARFDHLVEEFDGGRATARRAAADCICSMTEREAIALRNRLKGVDGGSVMHPLVR